jgi:hypothetical protein
MGRAVAGILAAWSLLAAACTGGGSPGSPVRRVPPLAGTILAAGRAGLVEVRLPSASVTTIPLSGSLGSLREAFRGPDGDLYAVTVEPEHRIGHLYRIAGDGSAVSVGRAVPGVRDVSQSSGIVALATCDAILTLDVTRSATWRRAGRGCAVALSPTARSFAFTRDGRAILERRLAGGPPHEVVALGDLRLPGGNPDPRLGALSWGGGGLAFEVVDTGGMVPRTATVVRSPDGRTRVLADWSQGDLPTGTLRWAPRGPRLAYSAPLHGGGVGLAIFDADGGGRRIVAVQQATFEPGFLDYAWSPDGNELAAVEPSSEWLFVDVSGDWIMKLPTGGAVGMFAWSSQ